MSTLTRGPRIVRTQVLALMKANLPAALTAYRQQWELKKAQLPDPVEYSAYEPSALDKLPVIAMSVSRTNGFRRVDVVDASEHYQVRYACRLFGWVKFLDAEPTQQIRDDYATVLGSVLLATPSLGAPGFRFEETTLDVSYSDVTPVRGDRFVAGVSLAFDVHHTETVRRVPLGVANALTVEATVLSEHPGLE